MTVIAEPTSPFDAAATYRGLFAVREFSALFVANVVSMLGTIVAQVALTVLVFQKTDSPALSALTFTVGFLPYLFGGALLGGLVDRWPARRTMVACDVFSALVFGVMALPGVPVAGLLGLAFVAGLVSPVFGGIRAALLPELLGSGARYVLGRATMRMVSQGSQVAGFAAGGLLLAVLGARVLLVVDGATFLASAVAIRLGIRAHAPVVPPASMSLVRDSLGGLRAVLSNGPTRRLLLMRWLVPTCALAPEALAVPYVHAVHGPQRAIGVYLAVIPAGMVLSDLIFARLLSLRAQRRLIVPGALLTTAPLIGFVAMPQLDIALGLLVVIGLGYCHGLALDALLLEIVPDGLQGRALAIDQAGLMVLQGVGFGVWGAAGEFLSLRLAITIAGGCGVAVTLAWRWSTRSARSSVT